jgi:hypothetical protein
MVLQQQAMEDQKHRRVHAATQEETARPESRESMTTWR